MSDTMHIVALSPPGRFPTSVPDTGEWWSTLAAQGDAYHLARLSANAHWWQTLCSPETVRIATATPLRRLKWRVRSDDLERAAVAAGRALEILRDETTYDSAGRYIAAVTPLAEYLALLNRAQNELHFSLARGVRVTRLDYDDSAAVTAYARRTTVLSELIAAGLRRAPAEIDLLVVRVTCPEDLLCAMIAVERLRVGRSTLHACLADHGYENFSLAPYLARLRTAHTLDRVFDTIVESKDDRDVVVPALARALGERRAPQGYLRHTDLPLDPAWAGEVSHVTPPPVEVFASEPIFWTRISPRRCYWSRCTFCVHNLKYEHALPPALTEVPAALDRLAALVDGGYRNFIFADEALSPALLRRFCEGVVERRLTCAWSCRCKLERSFTPELFQLMRAAGCYDVLFGLETTSPRMLRRMGKYTQGLDTEAIARIFQAVNAAGIGIHANLIGGFPGDTPAEVMASVEFVLQNLKSMTGATYTLNRFMLFPQTPAMVNASAYGIQPLALPGDMPESYPYRVTPELRADAIAVERLLPQLGARLSAGLGWQRFGMAPGARAAIQLYFTSGHSAICKARTRNVFANPLLRAVS
jgi:hypothetical protein